MKGKKPENPVAEETTASTKKHKEKRGRGEPKGEDLGEQQHPQHEDIAVDDTQDVTVGRGTTESASTNEQESRVGKGLNVSENNNASVATTKNPPVPKGRNVSGRSWKNNVQKRASSLIKTKVNNQSTTWERKVEEKNLRRYMLEIQNEMITQKKQAIADKKQRKLENEKRRMENEYNSIKNAAQSLNHIKLRHTLKAMSKKQLRQMKKTKLNTKTGVVEYVPLYSK